MKILERIGKCFEASCLEKVLQSEFDTSRFAHRLVLRPTAADAIAENVCLLIFRNQVVHFRVAHLIRGRREVSDAVTIDGISHLDLRFYFVAFRHRHLAHVVAETRDFQLLRIVPCTCGAHPGPKFPGYVVVLPESHHHLAAPAHAGDSETELAVTMGRLVQIHEIHIDG